MGAQSTALVKKPPTHERRTAPDVRPPATIRLALQCYEWLWRGATPLLGRNRRLRDGLPQRRGRMLPRGPFDIWIQAASAGESYLAGLLLEHLGADCPYHILVTTYTRQGREILDAVIDARAAAGALSRVSSAYLPFDRPALMQSVLASLQPRLMVLLETEIWPGLMSALKARGIPMLIVNARMQAGSLRHYQLWPRFWRTLAPDRILAVSAEDAHRYACLYGARRVSIMPNMKFDRIRTAAADSGPNPVRALIPPAIPLVVLGSVRREEEDAAVRIIGHLRDRRPDILIGLFPRHMHRLTAWRARLEAAGIPYGMRSQAASAPGAGTVLLWDVFGELAGAYAAAEAAFVGGSLAPLGGQNFLEPLSCGVRPTIGPSWDTFRWVGPDLFRQGLVRVAGDWRGVTDSLLATLAAPPPRNAVKEALADYVAERRGGTAVALAAIEGLLQVNRSSHPGAAP